VVNYREHREELFKQLFELKKVQYNSPRNRKYIDTYIYCTDEYLNTYFQGVIKKFGRGQLKQSELWSEIITFAYKAIYNYRLEDNFNNLIEHEKNKVRKYIKKYVYYAVKERSNPNTKKMTLRVDGERKSVDVDLEITSLNIQVTHEDTDTTLINLLNAESSIFHANTEKSYQVNKFILWYNEHKEEILTQSQLEFLDNLELIKELNNPTPREIKAVTGTESHQVNQKLKRIRRRIVTAWEEESEQEKKTRRVKKLIKQINKLNEFFTILNEEENKEVNLKLSEWVRENLESLENLLYRELSREQCIELTRLQNRDIEGLQKRTLYKVIDTLSDYLNTLESSLIRSESVEDTNLAGTIEIADHTQGSGVYILQPNGIIRVKEGIK